MTLTVPGNTPSLGFIAPLLADYAQTEGEAGLQVNLAYPVGDVRRYGAKLDGVTSDQTAWLNALLAAKGAGGTKRVYVPAGSLKLTATTVLDASYASIKIVGDGPDTTKIIKAFDGDLCDVVGVPHFGARGFFVDGQYGTHVGKGFVFTGTASQFPRIDRVHFFGLSDAHIEFGPDSGYYAKVDTQHFTGAGQPDFPSVRVAGPDTGATPRRLNIESNGYVDLVGATDTRVVGGFVTRVQIDDNCSITLVSGTVWANNGVPVVVSGKNTTVVGCRIAADVTLKNGMSGAFADNIQTGGTFTDNTAAGDCLVRHHPLASNYNLLDKHAVAVFPPQEVQVNATNAVGDTDYAFDPNASALTLVFSTPLTANRAISLATVGARNGQRLHVSRSGGNTGGPWTLAIGGTGKTLAASQWCIAQYNGGYWEVVAFGAL